jgi:hypothetical protein
MLRVLYKSKKVCYNNIVKKKKGNNKTNTNKQTWRFYYDHEQRKQNIEPGIPYLPDTDLVDEQHQCGRAVDRI